MNIAIQRLDSQSTDLMQSDCEIDMLVSKKSPEKMDIDNHSLDSNRVMSQLGSVIKRSFTKAKSFGRNTNMTKQKSSASREGHSFGRVLDAKRLSSVQKVFSELMAMKQIDQVLNYSLKTVSTILNCSNVQIYVMQPSLLSK